MRANHLSLIVALGICSVASASARASDEVPSSTVWLKDLDLPSPADVGRLDARLARAASAVCLWHGTKGVHASLLSNACRKDALSKASARAESLIAAAGRNDDRSVEVARRSTDR